MEEKGIKIKQGEIENSRFENKRDYLQRKSDIMWAVETILAAIGENPEREGLLGTPERVARMYLSELSIGTNADLSQELSAKFDEDHDEMVVVRDIPFYSLCEHHMVPYFGKAHVAYIPDGEVVGLSKIARLIEKATATLSIQENVTSIIADTIMEEMQPKGVMVIMNGEHLCMSMRGVKKPGSNTTTSAIRGVFKSGAEGEASPREEFLELLKI